MTRDDDRLADARDDIDPRYCDSCGGPCRDLPNHHPWLAGRRF